MKHRIVTAAQMKAIEQAGNAHGLPYLQMMENAGLAAYAELKNVLPQPGSLLVVCGKGNNSRLQFCHFHYFFHIYRCSDITAAMTDKYSYSLHGLYLLSILNTFSLR